MYILDDHIVCAVAGIDSDASILVNRARVFAQSYLKTYSEEIPCEILVKRLCDIKQGYTQYGGLRPFGVSFVFAGYDDLHGFQLYTSNPSGNYSGWKATSVGANGASAQTLLKQEYKEDFSLDQACELAMKVLSKTMDSATLTSEKLEFSTVGKDSASGKVYQKIWKPADIDALLKATGLGKAEEDD
ncbi:proteasome core particle subunit alpha 3 [Sugiyamaella lignohabitans]|uniref:Proteasome core particle subunit alpha 3 n=1 Tax=Sugiyamaella lignohabitans TaxID=796027 RepID=A0A167ES26_9ASCO|nr:proteasome core particle subunit alpha 3 [Sugiyamaella lignohabitans]ANB14402.1 proteasome core particle subunit alpha 3 [Sugiyamaella lignohabitans]